MKRAAEVVQRCRRELQARADQLLLASTQTAAYLNYEDSTLRLVERVFANPKIAPDNVVRAANVAWAQEDFKHGLVVDQYE